MARVHATLPAGEAARATVLAMTYLEAAALEHFGPALRLPAVISGSNNYWLWGPGECTGEVVVALGFSAEYLAERFEYVELAAVIPGGSTPIWDEDRPIWICRRAKQPLRRLWPSLRRIL